MKRERRAEVKKLRGDRSYQISHPREVLCLFVLLFFPFQLSTLISILFSSHNSLVMEHKFLSILSLSMSSSLVDVYVVFLILSVKKSVKTSHVIMACVCDSVKPLGLNFVSLLGNFLFLSF